MNQQMTNIPTLHPHDVLCGKRSDHEGNKYFRSLVKEKKYEYIIAPKKQKPIYARLIGDKIRSLNPPGRFLKYSRHTGLYDDIGDKEAITKTRQALREGAPEIEKQLKETGAARFGNKDFLPIGLVPSSPDDSMSAQPSPKSNPEPMDAEGYIDSSYEEASDLRDFLVDVMYIDNTDENVQCSFDDTNMRRSLHDANTRHKFYDARDRRSFYDAPFGQNISDSLSCEEAKEEVKEEFDAPNDRQQSLCSFRSNSVLKMSLPSMASSVMSNLLNMSMSSIMLEMDLDESDLKDDSGVPNDEQYFETYQGGNECSETSFQETFPHGIKNEITSIYMTEKPLWNHQSENKMDENCHHGGQMRKRCSWIQGKNIHERETQSQIHHRRRSSILVGNFVNAILQ